ncbi:hypothetical protein P171DRAFT_485973 [Karstenula rhodostoma CBS 690.94]|uniref:Uncharacterized protein n=1 Tax=Karstenula rhodostoma CBS 690.94 TaxID=1392251 RepID=A0A9P4PJW1_9PLEO|nr:hypothetical protein P171DRAFT_485973 [Karstenula rhodostoma CBS 690.94]
MSAQTACFDAPPNAPPRPRPRATAAQSLRRRVPTKNVELISVRFAALIRALVLLAILVGLLPHTASALAVPGAHEMFEIRDVLAQAAQREHTRGLVENTAHFSTASQCAQNVPERELDFALAFGALRPTLMRLQQLPQACGVLDAAAHHLERAMSQRDSFLGQVRGLASNMTVAAALLDSQLESVGKRIVKSRNTGVLQMDSRPRGLEEIAKLTRRKEALEGYRVALTVCLAVVEEYHRTWKPFLEALEALSDQMETWRRGGDECDAGDDFNVMYRALFQADVVLGGLSLLGGG